MMPQPGHLFCPLCVAVTCLWAVAALDVEESSHALPGCILRCVGTCTAYRPCSRCCGLVWLHFQTDSSLVSWCPGCIRMLPSMWQSSVVCIWYVTMHRTHHSPVPTPLLQSSGWWNVCACTLFVLGVCRLCLHRRMIPAENSLPAAQLLPQAVCLARSCGSKVF